MDQAPSKVIAEVEEELQLVLAGLQRFQRAAGQFEKGRQALDETAEQVRGLVDQAGRSLQPAVDAVATLRRLDPDILVAQVIAAASGVREQLSRVEQQQAVELERTRSAVQTAVIEIQAITKTVPSALSRMETEVGSARAAITSNRPLLMAVGGLGIVNLVMVIILLIK